MPMNFPGGLSPAGASLGLGSIPGLTAVAGLGDQLETDEQRRKRLAQLQQSQQSLTQNSSPAASSLFGGGLSGIGGTGRLF
jgi:hypothetical protein